MERQYVVIVKKGVDLTALDAEIASEYGSETIPNRSVDIANPRPGSTRMTHWMLTEEEANTLKQDDRILDVELDESELPLFYDVNRFLDGNFTRGTNALSESINWGLLRSNMYYQPDSYESTSYQYAFDGTGVDVVIVDTGIITNHPEFNDANGVSRIQQIDWYTESGLSGTQSSFFYSDTNGHGTHCASIAAGLKHGWAKNAHIYSMKHGGLATNGIPSSDMYDCIRLWHMNKNNSRPTVVNMSYGSYWPATDLLSLNYRGSTIDVSAMSTTDIWTQYGVPPTKHISAIDVGSAVTTELEELLDAGVHVFVAAGNDSARIDLPGGIDYDNTITFRYEYNGITYQRTSYYCRPYSPWNSRSMNVGNIDYEIYDPLNIGRGQDRAAFSSNQGPAVNIWAPGSLIRAAYLNGDFYRDLDNLPSPEFYSRLLTGTSMAAPQVCGVAALYAQKYPNATPDELRSRMLYDAPTGNLADDGNIDTYGNDRIYSLSGGPNKSLLSPFGKQPLNIRGTNASFTGNLTT